MLINRKLNEYSQCAEPTCLGALLQDYVFANSGDLCKATTTDNITTILYQNYRACKNSFYSSDAISCNKDEDCDTWTTSTGCDMTRKICKVDRSELVSSRL